MKLSFVYLSGITMLLFHICDAPIYYHYQKKAPKPVPRLQKVYRNKRIAALADGYVLGQKRRIPRKIIKAHKNLNLMHLFTPSGLHFSSLALIALAFAKLVRHLHPWLAILVQIPLYIFPFFFSGYYSIKRIVEYKALRELLKLKGFNPTPFSVFLVVFTCDFFIGTYKENPLSFIFSYIFLGTIFCMLEKQKFFWPYALLGAQIIVAFCFHTPLTYCGFLFGFFITGLFTLLFPFLSLNMIFPSINFSEILLSWFTKIVLVSSELSASVGYFYPEFTLVLLAIILPCTRKIKLLMTILLLITSFPIYNVPGYAFRKSLKTGDIAYFETSAVRRLIEKEYFKNMESNKTSNYSEQIPRH